MWVLERTCTVIRLTGSRSAARPNSLTGGARRAGVEALFVEEEYAGAKAQEHDGNAGGDAETRDYRGATVVSATDDYVAGNSD